MLITALFTIAKLWKQPESLPIDKWRKKKWCLYTMESYSAIKKNEILPFATRWIDLESIMLSKISKSEKDKYNVISLMWKLRNKTNEQRKKIQTNKQKDF